jgi:hypothetical protein
MPKTEVAKTEEALPAVVDEHAGVGMPELDAEDKAGQRRWMCLNVSKHPTTGEKHEITHFFDSDSQMTKEKINCVFLGISYSKRLYYYDGEKNQTLCFSPNTRDGMPEEGFIWTPASYEAKPVGKGRIPWSELSGVVEEKFEANVARPCAACRLAMDAHTGTTRIRPPCRKEYNFLGFDIDDAAFFLFRCRGGTAYAAQNFLRKFVRKNEMRPAYWYHVELNAELSKNGQYAQPKFDIVGGDFDKSAWGDEELEEWKFLAVDVGAGVLESEKQKEAEVVGGENGDDAPAF